MNKPNFFIIGAPKCGTTSLAAWLAEHPNIYMSPVKEPHFYSSDFNVAVIPNLVEYERLFKRTTERHIAVGEASTSYLYSKLAVPRIEEEYPGAKYIVMIRNPVDMVYSLHDYFLYFGNEYIHDFETAWRLSPERHRGQMVTSWCKDPRWLDYQSVCRLGEQLEQLFSVVPKERLLLLVLDDIKENSRREYLKVLDFLGVPDDGRIELPVKNPAKERKWPTLHKGIMAVGKMSRFVKQRLGIPTNRGTKILQSISSLNVRFRLRPPMSRELHVKLIDYYREDIEKLSTLIGRDFSPWLEV